MYGVCWQTTIYQATLLRGTNQVQISQFK